MLKRICRIYEGKINFISYNKCNASRTRPSWEWMNRTIVETACFMLHHIELTTLFWADVAKTAAFLMTCSPIAALDKKTPFRSWFNAKQNVCLAHVRQ